MACVGDDERAAYREKLSFLGAERYCIDGWERATLVRISQIDWYRAPRLTAEWSWCVTFVWRYGVTG